MRRFNNIIVSSLKRSSIVSTPIRSSVCPAIRFSSSLKEKEKGDESRYFAQQEAAKLATLKANVESILSRSDDDSTKAELLEILATEPNKEKTIIEKLGLNDWKFALPTGLLVGLPVISNEVLILDAESLIVVAFIYFCSTMYTQAGPAIYSALNEQKQEIWQQMKSLDDTLIKELKITIESNEKVLTLKEDIEDIYKITNDMSVAQAEAFNAAEEHKYRDAIVKKLDQLVALEDGVSHKIRTRLLAKVKQDVLTTFAKDSKVKEAALEQAISVLIAGPNGKLGNDTVGQVFATAVKNYKESYSKQAPGSDEIIAQLEKDIKAITSPPEVDQAGGNVYETHKIFPLPATETITWTTPLPYKA